jgi:chemotaxis protein CheD
MIARLEDQSLAVGLGEIKVSRDAGQLLVAYGLGSCVGIGAYDPVTRVAGLLHAVLPDPPPNGELGGAPGRYVATGLPMLLAELERLGAQSRRLVVRLAGGANMLNMAGLNALNIGERNVAAARQRLAALNLRVSGEEVGGNIGRTVRLYVADGRMTIRMLGGAERDL